MTGPKYRRKTRICTDELLITQRNNVSRRKIPVMNQRQQIL